MKTTLLSAAAALVLTTISPVMGSAQQNGQDGYRPAQNDGYAAIAVTTADGRKNDKTIRTWIAATIDGAT